MKGVLGSPVGPAHHMPAPCTSSSSTVLRRPLPHARIRAVTPSTSAESEARRGLRFVEGYIHCYILRVGNFTFRYCIAGAPREG